MLRHLQSGEGQVAIEDIQLCVTVNNGFCLSLRQKIAANALDEFPLSYLQQDICENIIKKFPQKSEKTPVKT